MLSYVCRHERDNASRTNPFGLELERRNAQESLGYLAYRISPVALLKRSTQTDTGIEAYQSAGEPFPLRL
jgi:hypothetical protein